MRCFQAVALIGLAAAACRNRPDPVMPPDPVRTPVPGQHRKGPPPAPAAGAAARTPPGGAAAAASDGPSGTAEPVATPPHERGDGQAVEAEVRLVLESWRDAWQRKALDAYLGFYSPDFLGDGMDLPHWAARKRDVFARAGDLVIGIEGLEVRAAPEGAIAEFTQIYQSGALHDRGVKTVVLRKTEGRFRILRESFRKQR